MIPPFDIFRIDEGEPRWIETAPTLEAARAQIQAKKPGEYLIVSAKTGHRETVTVEPKGSDL